MVASKCIDKLILQFDSEVLYIMVYSIKNQHFFLTLIFNNMSENVKTTDQIVKELFDKLQAKKAEVANAEKPHYITGGIFRYSDTNSAATDIMTVSDERKLVSILAFLKEREKSYNEAAAELNVKSPFTWLGFSVEDWKKDILTRVSILQLAQRRRELSDLEKRVDDIISPELKRSMEIEALKAILG